MLFRFHSAGVGIVREAVAASLGVTMSCKGGNVGTKSVLKPRSRIFIRIVIIVIVVYLISYSLLSVTGGYVALPSGRIRLSYGLSISDVLVWQPRFGEGHWMINANGRTGWIGDFLGWIYYPMMMLDQRAFHPTVPFRTEDGRFISPDPFSRLRMHPTRTRPSASNET